MCEVRLHEISEPGTRKSEQCYGVVIARREGDIGVGRGEGEQGQDRAGSWADLSGTARDVIQARNVSGGVHFHGSSSERAPVPRQLPGDVRGFVNRLADINRLDSLLVSADGDSLVASVCVIAGTAGVGKTSLAVHWAHTLRHRFPDGQLYINLRGYDTGAPVTASQALERFLSALGVAPNAVPTDLEARSDLYRSLLAERRILVVLDNAAMVGQLRPLLPGVDGCLTLVTSRSRLSGLVARDGAVRVTLDVFPEPESVQLLQLATAGYRVGDENEDFAELARLCARLPLALRIAAERAAARPRMPLTELIQDLRDESSVWDALSSDDQEEADAVRTVFAWSFRALSPEVARMFRLLGLHPGPDFSTLAAAALAGVSRAEARRLLDVLVGAHLVEQTAHERHQLHDLLRAYAVDQVTREETVQEREAAIGRVCDWYLRSMHAAAALHDDFYADDWGVPMPADDYAGLPNFGSLEQAMSWFSAETDNLVTASTTAAAAGLDHIAWKLPAMLRTPYVDRHPAEAWLPLGRMALESSRRSRDKVGQAITLNGLGIAHRLAEQLQQAAESHRAALDAARDAGDLRQEVAALVLLGHVLRQGRRLDEAHQLYERGLAIAREQNLVFWIPWATIGIAEALVDSGSLERAQEHINELIGGLSADSNPGLRAEGLWILASIERESGDIDHACDHIQTALDIAHEINNALYEGEFELEFGRVLLAAGRSDEALSAIQHAASIQRRMGDVSREADALDAAGEVYRALERYDEAVDFHRRAAALKRVQDDRWHLALILVNLATALDGLAAIDEAGQHYREALGLIADYGDSRARALRDRALSALEARDEPA
jgi:tetratricopeptide (TPR) repeat protein